MKRTCLWNHPGLMKTVGISAVLAVANPYPAIAQAPLPIVEAPDIPESALPQRFVAGEVIVKMKPVAGAIAALAARELSPLGLQSAPRRTSGGELIYQFTTARMFALQSEEEAQQAVEAIVSELNARDDVEYAQPNWIMYPLDTTPNDPGYALQWHYFNNGNGANESPGGINLPRAWDVTTGSSAVTVAVIDTGILPGHSDISGAPNLGAGFDMISNSFIANDGDGRDADPSDPGDAVAAGECFPGSQARGDSWHGTHVAGTVGVVNSNNGAGVAGVNWNVTLQPVRVLGKCGGTTVDINDAIRWAAGLAVPAVPNNPTPARVINLSLGGGGACSASPSTQAAVNDAVAAGVTVVVAAGNSAQDAANFTPASCDNVITVAASDFRGHLVERYSNFGDTIEIMAPGGDRNRDDNNDGNEDGVLSTVKGGYAFYNGTSMAAPHVAGVAALLLSEEPLLTPAQVLQRLQAAALPRDASQCPQPCGAGLLNADLFKSDEPISERTRYQYTAKLVCGLQRDPRNLQLTRGLYGTVINILNPNEDKATFRKTLSLAIPPGFQDPGEVISISKDVLGHQQALATDCEDIRKRVFNGQFPTPFIDGFVVIESDASLEVSAVYTSAAVDREGEIVEQSSVDVEQIRERVFKPDNGQGGKPDLVVRDIDLDSLQVSCPDGAGSCVSKVKVTIANIGAADAGSFNTLTQFDPAQSVLVDHNSAGLDAGDSDTFEVQTPPGGNCFDPDCTICVAVDNKDDIDESDESNNKMCKSKLG